MGCFNGVVSGRNRTTRNTGNRCQHNVLAELTLRYDHSGTERSASEISKWKSGQHYIATSKERRGHTGSPSLAV